MTTHAKHADGGARREAWSLWLLTVSPLIWSAHLLVTYITVAIWCAKVAGRDGRLGEARTMVAVYTVVALAGIGITTWRAYRRQQVPGASRSAGGDTPADRRRFLGLATLLLSLLSAVATVYVALTFVFIDTCH